MKNCVFHLQTLLENKEIHGKFNRANILNSLQSFEFLKARTWTFDEPTEVDISIPIYSVKGLHRCCLVPNLVFQVSCLRQVMKYFQWNRIGRNVKKTKCKFAQMTK